MTKRPDKSVPSQQMVRDHAIALSLNVSCQLLCAFLRRRNRFMQVGRWFVTRKVRERWAAENAVLVDAIEGGRAFSENLIAPYAAAAEGQPK